jgi:enoyl-CoA hydratase/carnithine racemase
MSAFAGEFVRLEVDRGIGTIRIDRPRMNALSVAVQEEIRAAAEGAEQNDDVAAVILYGGPDVFAAGADVKEMALMSGQDMVGQSGRLQSAFSAVAAIGKPTVSAITGYALGGGCELALCTDFRVAGRSAQLGQPEILIGIFPGAGGTQRLPRLIGPARAKDLIFSGRFVDAQESLAIGLVDRVVDDVDVYRAARDLVAPYVGAASLALRAAKQSIDRGLDVDLGAGLEIERTAFSAVFDTEDRRIGMTSFVESGPGKAVFRGR